MLSRLGDKNYTDVAREARDRGTGGATAGGTPSVHEDEWASRAARMLLGMDEPEVWAGWQPGRRPGWDGTQDRRRWELIQHSPARWTLRFVDADGSVTRSDSGSVEEIAGAIRGTALTGQARRRLLAALAHPNEPGLDSPIAVSVN